MCPKALQQQKVLQLYVSLILQLCSLHTNIVCPVLYSVVGEKANSSSRSQVADEGWFKNLLSERDAKILEHSGKMVLLFEILRMAEDLGDKVYGSFLIWSKFKHRKHSKWSFEITSNQIHFLHF